MFYKRARQETKATSELHLWIVRSISLRTKSHPALHLRVRVPTIRGGSSLRDLHGAESIRESSERIHSSPVRRRCCRSFLHHAQEHSVALRDLFSSSLLFVVGKKRFGRADPERAFASPQALVATQVTSSKAPAHKTWATFLGLITRATCKPQCLTSKAALASLSVAPSSLLALAQMLASWCPSRPRPKSTHMAFYILGPAIDTSVAYSDGSVTGSIAKAGSFKGSALIVPAGVDAGLIAVALRGRGIYIEGSIPVPAAAALESEAPTTSEEPTPAQA